MAGSLDDLLPEPPADGMGLFGDPAPAVAATPYRVLARKYRPVTFGDLIGQEAMVRILRNAFAMNRIAHAWMLTGVRGVGKTTTARIIARALNCVGPDGTGGATADPCGVCPNCVAILADRHPDVVEMDAASRTGVDDMREVIDAARYRPLQARTKVFIIDEVHMLSRNAFNALLKTLEEPPPHVKFIFATTEIRKVPVTVLSRCQRFDLRRVSVAEMAGKFASICTKEQVEVAEDALDLIARAADGSVRDGLSLLDQAIASEARDAAQVQDMLGLADRSSVFDLMEAVMAGEPAQVLAITDRAHERGADLGLMLGDLLELTHTLTRLKTVPSLQTGPSLPEMERVRGGALADRLDMPALGRAWQMLLKGTAEVELAPDRRAAAEMVLIRLCYVADLPPPGDLVRRLTEAGAPPRAPDGGGVRAVANGGMRMEAAAAPVSAQALAPAGPRIESFRDVAQLVAGKSPILHAQLYHAVHLVRFAPQHIELRQQASAPRDLASQLSALLQAETGLRWTIALSQQAGEATLAEQGAAADSARRASAAEHPLVRAILDAFPGAIIATVTDARTDAYGLMPLGEPELDEAGIRDFAPIDDTEDTP